MSFESICDFLVCGGKIAWNLVQIEENYVQLTALSLLSLLSTKKPVLHLNHSGPVWCL